MVQDVEIEEEVVEDMLKEGVSGRRKEDDEVEDITNGREMWRNRKGNRKKWSSIWRKNRKR